MLLGLDSVLGRGDRIGLVDANYPATRGRRLTYLPGLSTSRVLQVVGEPGALPPVVAESNAALARHVATAAVSLERNAFHAAAETAYAIVQTGERRFYGNILLTKGVIAPEEQS